MSIATELQNYADGLDDAWDAAEDMGATIPHDRNMNNLDDAIRTIPVSSPNDGVLTITQNGVTIQTFSADQSTNVTAALTDTTYSNFVGTDGMDAGTAGLVPAPATTDTQKYLSSDGSWEPIPDRSPVEFYWYNNDLYTDNMMSDQVDPSDVEVLYRDRPLLIDNQSNTSFESVISINGGSMINAVVMNYGSGDMVVVQYRYDYGDAVWTRLETNVSYSNFIGATSSVAGSNGLVPAPTTSDPDKFLKGDGTWGTPTDTTYTAGTNVQISAQNVISATDTTYSNFTGATSSAAGAAGLVPAPAAGDEAKALHGDGTWKDTTAKLVEMSYGEANAWAKFIAAYNAGSIVYCRASSNANPGTGSQTRKAFMAYVNNATSPTSVEFQYVRSASSKTDSQQCDQVFVYTLKNTSGGQWSVASRDMATKINVDSTLTKTYSSGANASMTLGAKAMTGATSGADGAAGIVPKPVAGDNTKFLRGDGTWTAAEDHNYSYTETDTHTTWLQGQEIYSMTYYFSSLADHGTVSQALPTGWTSTVKIEGIMRQGNSTWALPYPYCYIATDGTNLQVSNPDFDFTGMDAIITLYYIKTV